MATVNPSACPFCGGLDVRTMLQTDDGSVAFRCHACQRTFNVMVERREKVRDSAADSGRPEAPKK